MRGTPFAHFSFPMELDSWSTCDCLREGKQHEVCVRKRWGGESETSESGDGDRVFLLFLVALNQRWTSW